MDKTNVQSALNAILTLKEYFGDKTMSQIETDLKGQIEEPTDAVNDEVKPYYYEPEDGEVYYAIDGNGVIDEYHFNDDHWDEWYTSSGNCYETHEQATKALDKQKAIVFINKLIDKANNGWKWEYGKDYSLIVYDAGGRGFRTETWCEWQYPLVLIKSKGGAVLEDIIRNHKDKLALIFDIN